MKIEESKKGILSVAILWSLFMVYALFFHVEKIPSEWVNYGETYRLFANLMIGSISVALWLIVLLPKSRSQRLREGFD